MSNALVNPKFSSTFDSSSTGASICSVFLAFLYQRYRSENIEQLSAKFLGIEEQDVRIEEKNEVIKLEADWENNYTDFSDENLILASMAQNEFIKESEFLASEIQSKLDDVLNIKNRGVKQAGFYVLYGANMPNVLVELGFITNKKDVKLLNNK